MKRFLAVAVIAVVLTGMIFAGGQQDASAAGDAADEVQVIRIGTAVSDTDPNTLTAREVLKKEIEKATNGRYDVQVFANGQLGGDVVMSDSVREGTLDMYIGATAALSGIVKELNVLDLPFVFDDEAMADAILDGPVGDYLAERFAEKGFVLISWYEKGFTHFENNVRPISTPADLEGVKIRVMQNPIRIATYKAYGANPTPMAWPEVFTALQQDTIDGMENPVTTLMSGKFWEVLDYVSVSNNSYIPVVCLMSKKVFDKLPAEDQKIFLEAGKLASADNRKRARDMNHGGLGDLEANGMKLNYLTDAQKAMFREKALPVWEQSVKMMGDEVYQLAVSEIEKYRKNN